MYLLELIGEDDAFSVFEAACLAADVRLVAPGVAFADAVGPRISQIAHVRAISRLVGRATNLDEAEQLLRNTSMPSDGSAAVRARSIRGAAVGSQPIERRLGAVFVQADLTIDLDDPDHVLRVVASGEDCFLGWQELVPGHGFSARQPTDRPFFRPGSLAPRLARAIVNMAGAGPGRTVLDPMCGTGGFAIEAGLVGATVLASDIEPVMVAGTRENLRDYGLSGSTETYLADACRLPLQDGIATAAVFDVPYGRQSSFGGRRPDRLVRASLLEADRLAARAVVLADRSLTEFIEETPWWLERRLERRVHRSLTRHVHVLSHEECDR